MVRLTEVPDDFDLLHGIELMEAEADHEAAFNPNWLQDLIYDGHVVDGDTPP